MLHVIAAVDLAVVVAVVFVVIVVVAAAEYQSV